MWSYNNYDELYHYGILGMKWGVRRYQNKDGTLTNAGKKRKPKPDNRSDDAKEADRIKKKKVSEMSNAELQKLNNRQQLEQNYYRNNKGAIERGIAIAATTAAALGTMNLLYKNGNEAIKIGKKIVQATLKKGG